MLNTSKMLTNVKISITVALGVALFMALNLFLLGTDEVYQLLKGRILSSFVKLVFGIFMFSILASKTVEILNKRKFGRNSWQRWTIELVILLVVTICLTFFEGRFIANRYYELPFPVTNVSAAVAIRNSTIGILMFMIYEIMSTIEENRKLALSLALAEKERMASHLQALQQKLNPHFLFNSLNVLSELIYEDREKANIFIDRFSQVYRYVLEVSEETLVEVSQEIKFLNNYVFLQKIRFGDKLIVENTIDPDTTGLYVPPLSLQLLIENAIKHNSASKDRPLSIRLYQDGNFIVVQNNINVRNQDQPSTLIGHNNLLSTYKLLTTDVPTFTRTKHQYIARIPLISRSV